MRQNFLVIGVVMMFLVGSFAFAGGEQELSAPEAPPVPDAPADAEITIRVATNAPEIQQTPIVQWEQEIAMAHIFKNLVEAGSGGRIAVEVYGGGQLGDHLAVMEMVQAGTLEAAIGTGVGANFFPDFEAIYIPYLFKTEEIAWWVFDNSEYWQDFSRRFREHTGMVLLGMGQNGTRHFTHANKAIRTPEDLRGERIRVMQSPVFVEMMRAFRADAVPMAFSEVYTSMQTGVIDGHENPISVIASNSIYEVQSYVTLDGHLWSEDYFVMNEDVYESIPEELRPVIWGAARQAEVVNRGVETIHSQGVGLAYLRQQGMNVYVPTMEEKQAFADVAQPPVIQYLRDKLGDATIDGLLEAVEQAEQALGYR